VVTLTLNIGSALLIDTNTPPKNEIYFLILATNKE
jgi:hypothetical protein